MRRSARLKLALAAVLSLSLLVPASSQGAVTIGSNLGRPAAAGIGCPATCTTVQAALPSERQAPGGLVSPVNGTITLWRIGAGMNASPTALRVIRRLGGGLSTGAGTSATVSPAVNAISSFPTQLPIGVGETIGINCCQTTSNHFVTGGGTLERWFAPLADGGPGEAPDGTIGWEMVLNADIEPTATFSVIKAKPRKGGKVQITVDLPNAGTLAAGDKSAKLAAAARAGKKVKYLKRARIQVSGPGQAVLLVKPTKAARQALRNRGRLKAKLKLAFTPNGGTASTQVTKVKLKR